MGQNYFHTQKQEVSEQERGNKSTFWFLVNLSTLLVTDINICVFSRSLELPGKQNMLASEIRFCLPSSGDHRGGT